MEKTLRIAIVNGPNLNLTGVREPQVYGSTTFESVIAQLQQQFPQVHIDYFQSNIEGELINYLQQVGFTHHGIVINGGGYSHTSVAIADTLKAVKAPAVEVHISNVAAREEFRHRSFFAPVCVGTIAGLGMHGYELAILHLIKLSPHPIL